MGGRKGGKEPADEKGDGEYEVGYGKPPSSTKWVKGQSGNPKGRRKKPVAQMPDLYGLLKAELAKEVTVNEGRREVRMSMAEYMIKSLVASIAKGSDAHKLKGIKTLMDLGLLGRDAHSYDIPPMAVAEFLDGLIAAHGMVWNEEKKDWD
jgi:hypothetical protein